VARHSFGNPSSYRDNGGNRTTAALAPRLRGPRRTTKAAPSRRTPNKSGYVLSQIQIQIFISEFALWIVLPQQL
jgi:hypothetical protein